MLFDPTGFQLQRARLVADQLQVGARFGLCRIESQRTFIIQNGATEIAGPEIRVTQIVKQTRIPVAIFDERFVAVDGRGKIASGEIRVGLGENSVLLRRGRRCHAQGQCCGRNQNGN